MRQLHVTIRYPLLACLDTFPMVLLTKDTAFAELAAFFKEKPFVLFATGVSCALNTDFGMAALKDHLVKQLDDLKSEQQQQWQNVLAELAAKTGDFESAMGHINDKDLLARIVTLTANFVDGVDRQYAVSIVTGQDSWPAAKLIKRIFSTLTMGQCLHVATPNYDMLAEYAFTHEQIPYLTGFSGGFCRQFDWKKAHNSLLVRQKTRVGQKVKQSFNIDKHIRLYKPHGSLNTFELSNSVVECDAWRYQKPDDINRFMVTPGSAKYETLHEKNQPLDAYRVAVNNHSAFLFLGFGFNDRHLVNDRFREKLQTQQCPALVITRDLSPQIMNWAEKSPNLWVVCKQENTDFTRIYNVKFDDWLSLDDIKLWDFTQFAETILGA